MSRYFFNIRDTDETLDTEGIDLATSADARTEVIVSLGQTLTSYGTKFWSGPDLQIWMTDEVGAIVFGLCLWQTRLRRRLLRLDC